MTRTKVAVVGCGHLGTIHARLLAGRPDVELVAVVDPYPASREKVASVHGCAAFAEPTELIGRIDAAVVAVPTDRHAAVALPLLEAGIDLLVEKPIAATVEASGASQSRAWSRWSVWASSRKASKDASDMGRQQHHPLLSKGSRLRPRPWAFRRCQVAQALSRIPRACPVGA